MIRRLIAAALCLAPLPVAAQAMDAVTSARLLSGWRMADGTHMAALELRLAPGWKTYWRAPGDIGIPPRFDWRGSQNLAGVEVEWPAPERIEQGGMTSIGYHGAVTLPLHVLARAPGRDVALDGTVEIGVCRDVCIPMTLKLSGKLPANGTTRDGRIAAALASRPLSGAEAGLRTHGCTVTPRKDGALHLTARLGLPATGAPESVVIEAGNPDIWIAPARTRRDGGTLIAETDLYQGEGRAFALDRSKLRLTVIGTQRAVDIKGCPAN